MVGNRSEFNLPDFNSEILKKNHFFIFRIKLINIRPEQNYNRFE